MTIIVLLIWFLQFRFTLLCHAACEAPLVLPLGGFTYGEKCLFLVNDWHASLVPVYALSCCSMSSFGNILFFLKWKNYSLLNLPPLSEKIISVKQCFSLWKYYLDFSFVDDIEVASVKYRSKYLLVTSLACHFPSEFNRRLD